MTRASSVAGFVLVVACAGAPLGACGSVAEPAASVPGDAAVPVCEAGACAQTCAAMGGTLCGERCVDLASDHESCGRCDNACAADAVCVQGACTTSCPASLAACDGRCVDLGVDPHHCGACANDCGAAHVCAAGACTAYCPLAAARTLGPGNVSVAVGDVDGDGNADAVAISSSPNAGASLDVYLGHGDGTFQALASQPLAYGSGVVQLADLDRDGRLDAALLSGSGNEAVSVYLNKGGGVFAHAGDYAAGVWSADLALGDLDGDGAPDAVVANSGGSQWDGSITGDDVAVLFNDGHGGLARAQHMPAGLTPSSVAIADLDGDGAPDFLVTDQGDGTQGSGGQVFFGDGHGKFSGPQPLALTTGGALGLADLNGDSRPDVVVAGWDALLVVLNQGARRFGAPVPYAAPFYGGGLAEADMNGDGRVDLVVGGAGLGVLFNRGDGSFEVGAGCAYSEAGTGWAAASPRILRWGAGSPPAVVTVDDTQGGTDLAALWQAQ